MPHIKSPNSPDYIDPKPELSPGTTQALLNHWSAVQEITKSLNNFVQGEMSKLLAEDQYIQLGFVGVIKD